jgi:hypothetical protein
MASGESASSTFLNLLRELQKYVLGAVVGGLCTFLFQYKWWIEQENLATAKDRYAKAYQAIIDFSELYHQRANAVNRMWREYVVTQRVSDEHKALYSKVIFEWGYKNDTFQRQFGVLLDRPYFEDKTRFNPNETTFEYKNWKDIRCADAFEPGNGEHALWDLMRFHAKAMDHCLSRTSDVVEGMMAGKHIFVDAGMEKESVENFETTYDRSWHNMNIFRREALKRALCNYNEKTTDDLGSFIGLWRKRPARDDPNCWVGENPQTARAPRDASADRREAAPPERRSP